MNFGPDAVKLVCMSQNIWEKKAIKANTLQPLPE